MSDSFQEREWLELSLAQHSIWLESKLSVPSILQVGGWVRVDAELDPALVRQSISLLMARHEALRLRVDDENPRQWVEASGAPPVTIRELPSAADPDAEFLCYLEQVFASPLPLGNHALFQIHIAFSQQGQTYMLWRFHHLIADTVSARSFAALWSEAYLALTSDLPVPLSARTSYRGVIASDSEYLQSREYKADLDYWMQRFRPLPPPLLEDEDPEACCSAMPDDFYADWAVELEGQQRLQALADASGVSLSRVFFAVFSSVVAARWQQWDVVAGIALHRRDAATLLTPGMFSGVMPMRVVLRPGISLLQSVAEFSRQMDEDLRHQRMPIDQLARALGLFRAGRTRLFEMVLSYMPFAGAGKEQDQDELPIVSGTVALPEASPISLHVTELAEGLTVRVTVNPALLPGGEASLLRDRLRAALDGLERNRILPLEQLYTEAAVESVIHVEESPEDPSREDWVF